MATTTRHDTSATRPNWPEETHRDETHRDDTETLDLRDERDARVEPATPRNQHAVVVAEGRTSLGSRVLRVVGFLLAAVIIAAIALVAGLNTSDEVRIDAWADTVRIPIWAVIAIAAAAGFVAGRLLDSRRG
jgi:hypothetical protein